MVVSIVIFVVVMVTVIVVVIVVDIDNVWLNGSDDVLLY